MLSEQLLIDRAGNFTASENHRLMAGWDKPEPPEPELISLHNTFKSFDKKPLVGELKERRIIATGAQINEMWQWLKAQEPPIGLVTYAQEKALETLFEPDPSLNFETVHTRNGDEREEECMEILSERSGLNFVNTGESQVHIHNDEVGCTPDGVVLDELDLVLTGAEVKCKSPLIHARNLLINNADDMKRDAFDHFVQIQTAMLVTGADHWYFANYNPYAKTDWLRFKYIIIGRDDEFIKILKKRIEIAKRIKAEFLQKFKSESQLKKVE